MKQLFNIHTHTTRCHHAVGYDEQYILAAIEAGFTTLGFSEHIAYPGVEIYSDRILNKDIEEYLSTMYELKEKYKDKINILVGFEIEYFKEQEEYLLEMKEKVDYMIIGQHFRYVEGYNYDYFNNDDDVLMYARQIERALDIGLTKYVAHPDYFMLGRREYTPACKDASLIIIEAAKRNGAVLEVNLNGLRYGQLMYNDKDKYSYPSIEFFSLLDNQSKVCFGFDAHHPTTLLEKRRIDKCLELLNGCTLQFETDVNKII